MPTPCLCNVSMPKRTTRISSTCGYLCTTTPIATTTTTAIATIILCMQMFWLGFGFGGVEAELRLELETHRVESQSCMGTITRLEPAIITVSGGSIVMLLTLY